MVDRRGQEDRWGNQKAPVPGNPAGPGSWLLALRGPGPGGAIPGHQVGPGWTLATWGQSPAVAPEARYRPAPFPFERDHHPLPGQPGRRPLDHIDVPSGSSVALAAWSADGRRALLTTPTADGVEETVTELDLTDG